jgi:RNA polymerase sigma-70 factor (ECF subfamily)
MALWASLGRITTMKRRNVTKQPDLEALFHEEAMPHVDALFGAAMRLTRSRRDAEDLVQDTLLKAYSNFHRYKPGTNCRAWLFRIQTNTFINRYRKKQRERVYLVDDRDARPLAERITAREASEFEPRDETVDAKVRRLFGDEVSEALQRVPIDFRMAVLLADVHEFSYRECADIMDCPIGTVMSRLYRGRRLLRAELAEYAVERGVVSEVSDEYLDQIEKDRGRTVDLASWRAAKG